MDTGIAMDGCIKMKRRLQRAIMLIALMIFALVTQTTMASGKANVLLLTCMDFRLIDEAERYMTDRGLRNDYDQLIIAGASLGVLAESFPAWGKTFWEHLDVAIQLHHEHKIMVMDHRDCGAYKMLLGQDYAQDPDVEKTTHAVKLIELKNRVQEKYPDLEVELLLMSLDGSVEVIE